jgi:hypothetical protein
MAKIKENSVIQTKNIQESIQKFAIDNTIGIKDCDFTLVSVETHVKDLADEDFKLVNKDLNIEYKNKQKLLNEHVEIFQNYHIEIFQNTKKDLRLIYKIVYEKMGSFPKIVISPKSLIPHKKHQPKALLNLLYKELNKIKAKNNILINIFDAEMIKVLKSFVKYIYADKFVKNIKLPLFEGIEPERTQESKLILKFQQKEHKNQIIEVEKDEVLVIYYKPLFGKDGFDCHGRRIDADIAQNKEDLKQEVDKASIKIEETEIKKIYTSKIKGFVQFNEKKISVEQKIRISTISRVQNSVTDDQDNSIEVMIAQKDTNKDSVGEGVKLTSETIHISGHVGANSSIEALNLNIEGATHQDSTQSAKYATINRHKGKLRCHNAYINLLEGGEVHATTAEIETCLGGSIYAKDVKINHVKNNLKVFASNSITIRLISGEDNKFTINSKNIPILNSKIEFLKDDIGDLEYSLEEAQRHNVKSINDITTQINTLKDEIKSINNSVNEAQISIEKPLRGLNTICFVIDDENELIFKTSEEKYEPFHLEITENEIKLIPTNEKIILKD